jgi:hypothetical protein
LHDSNVGILHVARTGSIQCLKRKLLHVGF